MLVPSRRRVLIGGIDVTDACVGPGRVSGTEREQPRAEFDLDVSLLPSVAVDLAGTVVITDVDGNRPIFTGEVVAATLATGRLRVSAQTGLELTDTAVARAVTFGLTVPERVRTLFVQAGQAESALRIEGFPEPAEEYFEVYFPVVGVSVSSRQALPPGVLVGRSVIESHPWMPELEAADDLRRGMLGEADCFIGVGVVAKWVTDAEASGVQMATELVARLVTGRRYTAAVAPDGSPHEYFRAEARTSPRLLPYVLVRGATTGRGWIRSRSVTSRLGPITARPGVFALVGAEMSAGLRNCVLSLYRATQADLPLSQNLALWDAVEFYASNTRVPHLFSKSDHKRLMRRVIDAGGWSDAQRGRLLDAKKQLNEPSLLRRLRVRLAADGVPYTDEEFAGLARLRSGRNDAVHGRAMGAADSADLAAGIRLMARAVRYALDGVQSVP